MRNLILFFSLLFVVNFSVAQDISNPNGRNSGYTPCDGCGYNDIKTKRGGQATRITGHHNTANSQNAYANKVKGDVNIHQEIHYHGCCDGTPEATYVPAEYAQYCVTQKDTLVNCYCAECGGQWVTVTKTIEVKTRLIDGQTCYGLIEKVLVNREYWILPNGDIVYTKPTGGNTNVVTHDNTQVKTNTTVTKPYGRRN